MKKASREAKKFILTKKDFIDGNNNEKIALFNKMLSNPIYNFRVKKALYDTKLISAKGFLYNDDIYLLPLGTKNGKGEILIDNTVLEVFDRYILGDEMVKKGDALTAFMIDHSDELFKVIKTNKTSEVKMTDEEYITIFSIEYDKISINVLTNKITELLESDPILLEETNAQE